MPFVLQNAPVKHELDDGTWVVVKPFLSAGDRATAIARWNVPDLAQPDMAYSVQLFTEVAALITLDWNVENAAGDVVAVTRENVKALPHDCPLYALLHREATRLWTGSGGADPKESTA
jgi:hypothetical protein